MNETIQTNPLIDRLPPHLKQFIKPQNYDDYTAINQAVWRYVMRKNVEYFVIASTGKSNSGALKTGQCWGRGPA